MSERDEIPAASARGVTDGHPGLPMSDADLTKHYEASKRDIVTLVGSEVRQIIGELRHYRAAPSSPAAIPEVERQYAVDVPGQPGWCSGHLLRASVNLGKWMSAALDDPNVCAEMKADINEWFSAGEPVRPLDASPFTTGFIAGRDAAAGVADDNRTDDGSMWDRAAVAIAQDIRAIEAPGEGE